MVELKGHNDRRGKRLLSLAAFLCILVLAVGCRAKQPAGQAKAYSIKGIVVSSSPGELTVDTEAVPGLMPAMIMTYQLAKSESAQKLRAGDRITARLRIANGAGTLDQVVVTSSARPIYRPPMTYNQPAPGQQVPDFSFVNQDGHTIHLSQFRGKALLVTFIYTRCPLANYCVRMSHNFAHINRALARVPDMYRETHLLTVSFDPAHDTPSVLRTYGESYAGNKAFAHWDFAAPPEAELKKVEEFFDVAVTDGAGATLNHSLSTVVIGKNGKVVNWFPSNTWDVSQVLQALENAAG